jgi:MYXO-CTERM domain-containing protein
VTCKPFSAGKHETLLSITIDGKNHPVKLTCITGPLLQIEPKKIQWVGVDVGSAEYQDLALKNVGGEALQLDLAGTEILQDKSAFSMDLSLLKSTIAVGDSQTLSVKFAPTEYLDYSATLQIASNSISATDSVDEVSLLGSSLPKAALDPELLDFGCVKAGETQKASVKISNVGAGSLSLELKSSALDGTIFELVDYDEAELVAIAPNDSSAIEVSCSPTEKGNVTADLVIADESTGAAGDLIIPLACSTGSACGLSSEVLDWGVVKWDERAVTRALTINNTGCAEMTATVFQPAAGTGVQEFQVTSPCQPESSSVGCEFTVPLPTDSETPGSVTIDVLLDPSINPTAHSTEATVQINTDCLNQEGPLVVTLRADIAAPEDGTTGDGGDEETGATSSGDDLGAEIQDDVGGGAGSGGQTDGGTGDGCGCRTTPSQPAELPMGSVLILMLMVARVIRRRTSPAN